MSNTPIKQSFLNKARKDKFLLVFDLPPALKQIQTKFKRGNDNIIPDTVQFSVYGVVTPGLTVKAVPARYSGSNLYVSSHAKDPYPPINLKFTVDSGYDNYWAIYSWLNFLHDQKTGFYNEQGLNLNDENFKDYQTTLTLYALDEYDNKVMKIDYTKSFPTSIDEITYDEQQTGEMEITSGFTFVFSQLHMEMIGGERNNETLT